MQDETPDIVLKAAEIKHLEQVVALLREQVATLRMELDRAHQDKERQAETHRQVLRLLEHQRPAPVMLARCVRTAAMPRSGALGADTCRRQTVATPGRR